MSKITHVVHPFRPLYDGDSKILVLGSFPSVKSRENEFFYGHPRNRFWAVIAGIYDEDVPFTIDEKKRLLADHGIALWDTVFSCDIEGSADSSIRNIVPTDLAPVIEGSGITRIYCNGATSWRMYRRYHEDALGIEAVRLPSTSPANAAWSLERLIECWRVIVDG